MLSALASVLLLGIVQAEPAPPPRTTPGIEVFSVSAPSKIAGKLDVPRLSASGVLLLDAVSGEELYSVDPDGKRPMASLTKIMTALLILENHEMNEFVTVAPIASDIRGSTIGLKTGQTLTVGNLLRGLLLPSANDAAYALAVYHSRSVSTFVKAMNERGKALGLANTAFANPAGLDNPEQYSTPRDLGWLAMAALKDERFRGIVNTRSVRIVADDGEQFDLKNTNELLHYNDDVFGVKTGTTDDAGECLIVLFTEDDHPYLLVLLGSAQRYTDSLNILQAVHDAR